MQPQKHSSFPVSFLPRGKKFRVPPFLFSKPGITIRNMSGAKSTYFPRRWQGKSTVQNICSLHSLWTGGQLPLLLNTDFHSFSEPTKNSSHLFSKTKGMVECHDLARDVKEHRPRPQRNSVRRWGDLFHRDLPGKQARQCQEAVK